jgi:transposase
MKKWEFLYVTRSQGDAPQGGIPMSDIVPKLRHSVKEKLLKHFRCCRDAGTRVRYLIIINLVNGRDAYGTADVLGVHNTTVYRVAKRFRNGGEWALLDGREDCGTGKLDERYLATLYQVVRAGAQQYGWRRPTWTREMLVETLAEQTGVRIHVATMSRALALVHARRARPRPVVRCPWSRTAKNAKLAEIRNLLASLPKDQVAVYEDEVDIHLNPKIGLDWMVRGQQKEVVTPGQNVKRYLAGALDVRTGMLSWVEGERKTSALFIALLDRLRANYRQAKVIHVILDNYRIHDSRITQAALANHDGRIQLHFLPPYCPKENRIERLWEDLHANVTRNHKCADMASLMTEVREYLYHCNRETGGVYYHRPKVA